MTTPLIYNLAIAIDLLKAGNLVSFPTETVYGLGADVTNPAAVAKVFALKGRPTNHPLIIHLATIEDLANVAGDIPEAALKLAYKFWPGPLTLILNKQPHISETISGGQDTIAVRIPAHPLARELLSAFPCGLVGPSANKFGHISPTTAAHVLEDFASNDLLAGVIEGGQAQIGIESTIVDCRTSQVQILRHGQISASSIRQALACELSQVSSNIRVPGNLNSHYAPRTPSTLASAEEILTIAEKQNLGPIAVLSWHSKPHNFNGTWLIAATTADDYAQSLYANLRYLDSLQVAYILIERPLQSEAWQAINDRLRRATSNLNITELLNKTFVHG